MKKYVFLALVWSVLAWSAAAQTEPAPGQQQPQAPPISPQTSGQSQNPVHGEDVGQQGKGVPTGGQAQNASAQGENAVPANATILATLSKGIDAKKAKEGDQVTAKVEQDLLNEGNVVIPRGARIVGHVTNAKARAKGEDESELGIAWDRAALKDGREVPFHAIIQAVAPAQRMMEAAPPMSETPSTDSAGQQGGTAGSMGNPGGMGPPSGGQPGAQTGGEPGAIGNPGGNAPQPPASTGRATATLRPGSSGVQGMPGVTLKINQQGTSLLTDAQGSLKLEGGTQLLLRVVTQ